MALVEGRKTNLLAKYIINLTFELKFFIKVTLMTEDLHKSSYTIISNVSFKSIQSTPPHS